jgi:hypothetical protein
MYQVILRWSASTLSSVSRILFTSALPGRKLIIVIKSGLFDAEEACQKIHEEQNSMTNPLTDEQSQAVIARHRKFLDKCCDFIFACNDPSSPASLRSLPTTLEVPRRMRKAIQSLLDPFRHSPHTLDHVLAFSRHAYSFVGLHMEMVPSPEYPWTEMLEELARYHITILGEDPGARKVWSGVADTWYNKGLQATRSSYARL